MLAQPTARAATAFVSRRASSAGAGSGRRTSPSPSGALDGSIGIAACPSTRRHARRRMRYQGFRPKDWRCLSSANFERVRLSPPRRCRSPYPPATAQQGSATEVAAPRETVRGR
eukprot:scaffold305_cov247-Pinguiococcus_pyrenoidosus.AAC.23